MVALQQTLTTEVMKIACEEAQKCLFGDCIFMEIPEEEAQKIAQCGMEVRWLRFIFFLKLYGRFAKLVAFYTEYSPQRYKDCSQHKRPRYTN